MEKIHFEIMIFRQIFCFFSPENSNEHVVYETVKKPSEAHTTKNPEQNQSKLFHCEYCPDVEFDSKRKIRNHTEIHVKKYGFGICTISGCGQKYTSFQKHMNSYHSQKQPNLTRHEQFHTGEQLFECELCSEKFGSQISRRNHKILEHTLKEVTLFCEYCKRPFFTKQRLETHRINAHLQAGPHRCNECARLCGTIVGLRLHMKSHGKRDRKCKYCPQLFKTNAVRSHHERMQHEWKDRIQIYYNAAMKKE